MKFLLRPLLVLLAGAFILGARQADEKRQDFQAPTSTSRHGQHYLARPTEAVATEAQWHQLYLPARMLTPALPQGASVVLRASYSPSNSPVVAQP